MIFLFSTDVPSTELSVYEYEQKANQKEKKKTKLEPDFLPTLTTVGFLLALFW